MRLGGTRQRRTDLVTDPTAGGGEQGQAPADGPSGEATKEAQSDTSNETFVKAAQEGINNLKVDGDEKQ